MSTREPLGLSGGAVQQSESSSKFGYIMVGLLVVVVAVVGIAGPFSFFSFLFGFPIWLLATGIVIAVKQKRGTLGSDSGGSGATVSSAPPAAPAQTQAVPV